jgi:hypothetical protein
MGCAGAHDGLHVRRGGCGDLRVSLANTGAKRLLRLLLRLYGPKQIGRPVMVPVVMLPAIQISSVLMPAET